jgi:hypothetical protein
MRLVATNNLHGEMLALMLVFLSNNDVIIPLHMEREANDILDIYFLFVQEGREGLVEIFPIVETVNRVLGRTAAFLFRFLYYYYYYYYYYYFFLSFLSFSSKFICLILSLSLCILCIEVVLMPLESPEKVKLKKNLVSIGFQNYILDDLGTSMFILAIALINQVTIIFASF